MASRSVSATHFLLALPILSEEVVVKTKLVALIVAATSLAIAKPAAADPNFFFFAGTTVAGDRRVAPPLGVETCPGCTTSASRRQAVIVEGAEDSTSQGADAREPMSSDYSRPLVLSFGVAGDEGPIRGGTEMLTIFGFSDTATVGFTGVSTFAGFTGEYLYLTFGLGLGSYWGEDRLGTLDGLAGTARGELGLRITDNWVVSLRGDLLVSQNDTQPFLTIGITWLGGQPSAPVYPGAPVY